MTERTPKLVWMDSEKKGERVQLKFDQLLDVPDSYNWWGGRCLQRVLGNCLRGRQMNENTIHIWHVEYDDLPSNTSLHGAMPSLVGDAWGETLWGGPLLAVMMVGRDLDPRRIMDINLTAYRDAIDYLGYFRQTIGSMIDGIGSRNAFSRTIMAERCGKVWGIRINCKGDQARGKPELERVAVPKTHPLFNLEGDNPFDIPDRMDCSWVAKSYLAKSKSGPEFENPLARLLLLRTSVEHGKWTGLQPWWNDPNIGSILVVDRGKEDLDLDDIEDMCGFIRHEMFLL